MHLEPEFAFDFISRGVIQLPANISDESSFESLFVQALLTYTIITETRTAIVASHANLLASFNCIIILGKPNNDGITTTRRDRYYK